MRFIATSYDSSGGGSPKNTCYLVKEDWDDFSFKTRFKVQLYDSAGNLNELGSVKILVRGLKSGRPPLQSMFSSLNQQWCSLGMDRDYYIGVSRLEERMKREYLIAIRDCVFDLSIFDAFEQEEGMQSSLLRDVSVRDVRSSFPRILAGDSALTSYKFKYKFNSSANVIEECEFAVEQEAKPPTNVHVLIGRNGVGKTRLLAGMADALTHNKAASFGLRGEFVFADDLEKNEFLNLVIVSYSAFDRFDPVDTGGVRSKKSIPSYYIGIKARAESVGIEFDSDRIVLKSAEDFVREFEASILVVRDSVFKWKRWNRAIEILCSDPGIKEFKGRIFENGDGRSCLHEAVEQFRDASSGHKIVLLTITRLVEHVNDRSLVIIDEPETHLHPPLLGSFVRATSELLVSQNGVAIIATHSPVVLQEVPARCVLVVSRSGERMRIKRPGMETFAENVGALTRKVFGLEVAQSGFYRMLKESAEGRDFDEVLSEFGNQVGTEGRALARAFTVEEDEE